MKTNSTCDACEKRSVGEEVREFIEQTYPEFDPIAAMVEKEPVFVKADATCNELHRIYEQRHKHDLHWAFKQASSTIILRQEKLGKRLEDEIPNFQEIVADTSKTLKQQVKRIGNVFDILSVAVSVIDIVVSVALILVVTMIAGGIEAMIDSLVLNIIFVAVIALAKVSLDRFFIIPRVEAWGWKRYHRAIEVMRQISIRLIAVGMLLEDAAHRGEDHDKLVALFMRIFEEKKLMSRLHRRHLERLLAAKSVNNT